MALTLPPEFIAATTPEQRERLRELCERDPEAMRIMRNTLMAKYPHRIESLEPPW